MTQYKQYIHIPTGKTYTGNGAGSLIPVDGSTNSGLPLWIVENSKDWLEVSKPESYNVPKDDTFNQCVYCGHYDYGHFHWCDRPSAKIN